MGHFLFVRFFLQLFCLPDVQIIEDEPAVAAKQKGAHPAANLDNSLSRFTHNGNCESGDVGLDEEREVPRRFAPERRRMKKNLEVSPTERISWEHREEHLVAYPRDETAAHQTNAQTIHTMKKRNVIARSCNGRWTESHRKNDSLV